jgi:hypothetical protein
VKELLGQLLETFKDVQHELGEPEVAELISIALDRKVETAIDNLEQQLAQEQ